jgi:transposase
MIIPEPRPDSGASPTGRIEIVVAKGRRLIVDAELDAAALARVIAVLDRR